MRNIAPLSFLLSLTLLWGCQQPTSQVDHTALPGAVQIERAEFGLFKKVDGNSAFSPSRTVPLSVNQAYGWVVKLHTNQEKIKWREEFTLPAAPAVWGDLPATSRQVSDDGKTSILEREVVPVDGTIFNSWSVAAGDPPGLYTIRLTVADAKPIVFEFEVR